MNSSTPKSDERELGEGARVVLAAQELRRGHEAGDGAARPARAYAHSDARPWVRAPGTGAQQKPEQPCAWKQEEVVERRSERPVSGDVREGGREHDPSTEARPEDRAHTVRAEQQRGACGGAARDADLLAVQERRAEERAHCDEPARRAVSESARQARKRRQPEPDP